MLILGCALGLPLGYIFTRWLIIRHRQSQWDKARISTTEWQQRMRRLGRK